MGPSFEYPCNPSMKEDSARSWAMKAKRLYDQLAAVIASSTGETAAPEPK
jgi:hypothetical protein